MHRYVLAVFLCVPAFSFEPRRIQPSAETLARLEAFNRDLRLPNRRRLPVTDARPYADYEQVGYLILSDALWHDAEMKPKLLAEIPSDITAVILVEDAEHAAAVKARWGKLRPEGRLKFLVHKEAKSTGALWARDSIPIPMISKSRLSVVASRNWFGFDPWEEVSAYFSAPMTKSGYYFEGGNFKADKEGNCFIVDARLAEKIPSQIFFDLFGCKRLARFPLLSGIGHADERVMLFDNQVAFTDEPAYQAELEKAGYKVTLLPAAGGFRTYLNVLLLNAVLFVPTFETRDDAKVLDSYRALGFRVVGIDSRVLSDEGHGSIHCLTMAYPPGGLRETAESDFVRLLGDDGNFH